MINKEAEISAEDLRIKKIINTIVRSNLTLGLLTKLRESDNLV